jgi:hypothetical protein
MTQTEGEISVLPERPEDMSGIEGSCMVWFMVHIVHIIPGTDDSWCIVYTHHVHVYTWHW